MQIFSHINLRLFSAAAMCAACLAVSVGAEESDAAKTQPSSEVAIVKNRPSLEYFNASRLKLISLNFERSLKEIKSTQGTICIVRGGKEILCRTFPADADLQNTYPIGKASAALISLAAVSAQNGGLANIDAPLSAFCSYLRLPSVPKASMAQLLNGSVSFDSHCEALVPLDSTAAEFFEIAAQLPLSLDIQNYQSPIAISLAGYSLGYVCDKSEKNFKKSFVRAMDKFVFKPLAMDGVKYRAFNSPAFPAYAFALTTSDFSKWLCAETSAEPKIASANAISARRVPADKLKKFGLGWIKSAQNLLDFYMCGDSFQNSDVLVAVFPHEDIAVAVALRSADKNASKICRATLAEIIKNIENPIPQK